MIMIMCLNFSYFEGSIKNIQGGILPKLAITDIFHRITVNRNSGHVPHFLYAVRMFLFPA